MLELTALRDTSAPACVLEKTKATSVDMALARDVIVGLSGIQKSLPSRWFYDDEGSRLFQKIMALPEYYPTRLEHGIFKHQAAELASWIIPPSKVLDLIDLGSGDGAKTISLCEVLRQAGVDLTLHAVDVSAHALTELCRRFESKLPSVVVNPVLGDYFESWPTTQVPRRQAAMFLGSNLGNLAHSAAEAFLQRIRSHLRPGDILLLGLDLQKDPRTVLAAYDDAKGVTAEFNLNLLRRLNRELEMDFDLSAFSHYATYSPLDGASRSFIVSQVDQVVRSRSLMRDFKFAQGESIYTEQSQKYTFGMIESLASVGGYKVCGHVTDERRWYCVSVLHAC